MEQPTDSRKKSARAQLASHHIPYYARLRHRRYLERHSNGWFRFALGIGVIVLATTLFSIGMGFAVLAAGYAYLVSLLPAQIELGTFRADQSTKIYDRYGNLLFEVFGEKGGRRTLVAPENISTTLKQAVIATEDPSFYENPGVDIAGLARATSPKKFSAPRFGRSNHSPSSDSVLHAPSLS